MEDVKRYCSTISAVDPPNPTPSPKKQTVWFRKRTKA
jgi:hypothetical protein